MSIARPVIVLGMLSAAAALAGGPVTEGTWVRVADMGAGRAYHTLALLPDGRVLAVGGHPTLPVTRTAEVYDAGANRWTFTTPTVYQHAEHAAAVLADGRVLVVGGQEAPRSAEVYDAAANRWTAVGSMAVGRFNHTATTLADGRVLVVGGWDATGTGAVSAAELFDPIQARFVAAGSLHLGRDWHTAARLQDGRVIVAGGFTATGLTATVERWDPATGIFATVTPMGMARAKHSMVTLAQGGRLLVAGGCCGRNGAAIRDTEVYDASADRWTVVSAMNVGRSEFPMVALSDGSVLVSGGEDNEVFSKVTERLDPATGTWSVTKASIPEVAAEVPMIVLRDGRLLVAGGMQNDDFYLTTPITAIYRP